ncbi:nucleoside hydrolase [Bacillus lacus]|uniref:Nucleoside hydrolase n=1 Tax=Metabacillus lacus TaxID=1983721 RepID=A0A7X2IW59_9BACI|nr:nucleoside hydrolase [Metabacillus lacus]MRX70892.1 nucleoside hydrolase [Metabacillus lacus]
MSRNVLLFADFGIDDIAALLYGYYSSEVNIVGIVADYGNVPKETAMQTALYLRKVISREDVPVIVGAEQALTGETPVYYPEIHGKYGLGPIIPHISEDGEDNILENFLETSNVIRKYQNNLTIVNVGRMTSLATSFVLYPEVMKLVNEYYIMGGAFLYPGNITPIAEANIHGDPFAANIVFTLAKNVTILPLNVTNYAIITPQTVDELDQFYKIRGDAIGEIYKPMLDYYYQFYKERVPAIEGSPLHDVLTLWAVTHPGSIEYVEKPVKVDTSMGGARGLSIGDFRPFQKLEDYPVHRIAIRFDQERFQADYLAVMKSLPSTELNSGL